MYIKIKKDSILNLKEYIQYIENIKEKAKKPIYGIAHRFQEENINEVSSMDLSILKYKYEKELKKINKALDKGFLFTLSGLPTTGKSTILYIFSELLKREVITTDDFVESAFIDYKKHLKEEEIKVVEHFVKNGKTVRNALKKAEVYKELRKQKVNEAIEFANKMQTLLDCGGKETSINQNSVALLKELGIKIVYIAFSSQEAYLESASGSKALNTRANLVNAECDKLIKLYEERKILLEKNNDIKVPRGSTVNDTFINVLTALSKELET